MHPPKPEERLQIFYKFMEMNSFNVRQIMGKKRSPNLWTRQEGNTLITYTIMNYSENSEEIAGSLETIYVLSSHLLLMDWLMLKKPQPQNKLHMH